MPKIYLLRHAQSQANLHGILAGPDNSINLSNEGIKQSKIATKSLKSIDFSKIYTSPITRCIQTIEPLLRVRPTLSYQEHINLSEMDYGDWNGKKLTTLSKKSDWQTIQSKPSKFKFPNGESFVQLRKRVQDFLDEVERDSGPLLVVSHGDVIKMFLACTLDQPTDNFQRFAISPASLSIIEYDNKNKSISTTNQRISKETMLMRVSKFLPGGENG